MAAEGYDAGKKYSQQWMTLNMEKRHYVEEGPNIKRFFELHVSDYVDVAGRVILHVYNRGTYPHLKQ